MKKVLSLVLAFAMILGSFGFVFANQYPDVKDTEVYSEPVNVLSGLGVVGGFPDGTFKPDENVTRAQMAVMLMNCLGIPVSGKAATGFTDVPATHWASGYIKYAASLGYIAGMGDGTFHPDDPVTYDQALTMIVASLGYTSEGLTGDWPGNFINAARGLGLLKICKTTGSSAASRADVCCFLYQALTSPIGRTNKDGEFVPSTPEDTMIDRLGAVPYAPGGAGTEGDAFVVTGDEISNVNLGEYLGACITAYADDSNTIIAIKEVKSQFVENTVKKIKSTYSKTDSSVWGDPVAYFENGEEDSSPKSVDDFGSADFIKVAVSLTNGKTIGEIYSIQAWYLDDADFAADDVQDDINDDHKLLSGAFTEDEDGEIDMNSFVLLGRDSLADIAEGDVVYIYCDSANKITKIEVGTETVEGKITKMTTSGDQITVGGKTYALGEGCDWANLPSDLYDTMTLTKASCTFYLDYAGDIFDYEEDSEETSDSYAVLLKEWDEKVEGETSYYGKFFLSDGSVVQYEMKSSLYGTVTPGSVVSITKSSKNVVTAMTDKDGNDDWEISKNGVVTGTGLTISSSTVVFKFSGSDVKDADNYSVLQASTLFGTKATDIDFILKDKSVKAMLISGATGEESEEVAYIVEEGELTATGQEFIVLYEGQVQELNFETPVAVGMFCTLTMDEDGNVTATGTAPAITYSWYYNATDLAADVTGVSGNVFTDPYGDSYDIASDIVVYVCDSDGNWSVGSKANLKQSKKGKLAEIKAWSHNSDKSIDYALVYEN